MAGFYVVLAALAALSIAAAFWLTRAGDNVPQPQSPAIPYEANWGNKTVVPLKPKRAPAREAFDAWRDDPTTQFIMAALARNAEECGDKWFHDSWVGGVADQRQLDGLRERADALRGIAEADYTAFCEILGLEPEPLNEEHAA